VFITVCRFLFFTSIAECVAKKLEYPLGDSWRRALVELETIGWLIFVVIGLVNVRSDGSFWSRTIVVLCTIRLLNIVFGFALRYVFVDDPQTNPRRATILLLVDLAQIAIIFGSLYAAFPRGTFSDPAHANRAVEGASHFLYLSWTTLLTMGSGYSTADSGAQALILIELSSGLLMVAVTIGTVLQAIEVRARK
jgi:hypothetical protein